MKRTKSDVTRRSISKRLKKNEIPPLAPTEENYKALESLTTMDIDTVRDAILTSRSLEGVGFDRAKLPESLKIKLPLLNSTENYKQSLYKKWGEQGIRALDMLKVNSEGFTDARRETSTNAVIGLLCYISWNYIVDRLHAPDVILFPKYALHDVHEPILAKESSRNLELPILQAGTLYKYQREYSEKVRNILEFMTKTAEWTFHAYAFRRTRRSKLITLIHQGNEWRDEVSSEMEDLYRKDQFYFWLPDPALVNDASTQNKSSPYSLALSLVSTAVPSLGGPRPSGESLAPLDPSGKGRDDLEREKLDVKVLDEFLTEWMKSWECVTKIWPCKKPENHFWTADCCPKYNVEKWQTSTLVELSLASLTLLDMCRSSIRIIRDEVGFVWNGMLIGQDDLNVTKPSPVLHLDHGWVNRFGMILGAEQVMYSLRILSRQARPSILETRSEFRALIRNVESKDMALTSEIRQFIADVKSSSCANFSAILKSEMPDKSYLQYHDEMLDIGVSATLTHIIHAALSKDANVIGTAEFFKDASGELDMLFYGIPQSKEDPPQRAHWIAPDRSDQAVKRYSVINIGLYDNKLVDYSVPSGERALVQRRSDHANSLIVDHKNKTMSQYEPHGGGNLV